jgi:hypothetical protein
MVVIWRQAIIGESMMMRDYAFPSDSLHHFVVS